MLRPSKGCLEKNGDARLEADSGRRHDHGVPQESAACVRPGRTVALDVPIPFDPAAGGRASSQAPRAGPSKATFRLPASWDLSSPRWRPNQPQEAPASLQIRGSRPAEKEAEKAALATAQAAACTRPSERALVDGLRSGPTPVGST